MAFTPQSEGLHSAENTRTTTLLPRIEEISPQTGIEIEGPPTPEAPTFVEFSPITVDGITFFLINGEWHVYYADHVASSVTPTRVVIAGITAEVIPIENASACIPALSSEEILDLSGVKVIRLPVEQCIAVVQQEAQRTIDLTNPDLYGVWVAAALCGVVVMGIVIKNRIKRYVAEVQQKFGGANTERTFGPEFGDERPLDDPRDEEKRQERIARRARKLELMNYLANKTPQELAYLGLNPDYTSALGGRDEDVWDQILAPLDHERVRDSMKPVVIPRPKIRGLRGLWHAFFDGPST